MSDLSLLLATPEGRSGGQSLPSGRPQAGNNDAWGAFAISFQALLPQGSTPAPAARLADLTTAMSRSDNPRFPVGDRPAEREPARLAPGDRGRSGPPADPRADAARPAPGPEGPGKVDRRPPRFAADVAAQPAPSPIHHAKMGEAAPSARPVTGFAATGPLGHLPSTAQVVTAAHLAVAPGPLPGGDATAPVPGVTVTGSGVAGSAGVPAMLMSDLVAAGMPDGRVQVTFGRHADLPMPQAAVALAPAAVLAAAEGWRGPGLASGSGTTLATGGDMATTSLAFQALAAATTGGTAPGTAQAGAAPGAFPAMTGTGPEGNAAFSALPMPPTPIVTAPAPGIATAVGSATPSVPTALSDGPGIGGTTTAQLDTTTVRAEAAMHRAQPFLQRAVSDQVTVHITKAVREGSDHIEIKLRPAALGRVDVRLELGADGRVLATVTADTRQTLEMLRADARGLERALQDAGLQADSGSLSFNLRGDGHAQDRGEPRPGSVAPSADPAAGAGEDTAGHDVATANQNAAARRGGVDLHV